MRKITRRMALGGVGIAALAACASRIPSPTPVPDSRAEAEFPPLGRVVRVDGLDVHATDEGSGPPVVLIHGASANLRDWTFSISRQLARSFRVIAMDRPGFGYSERGPGLWTPSRQAAQLRAALAQWTDEPPVVVGHSWGAAVALAWGLDAPRQTLGVVSVSGATMPWGIGADIANALGINRLGVAWYSASLSRRAEEGAIEDFVARAFRPQSPPPGYLDHIGAPLSLRDATLDANAQDLVQLHRALSALEPRYPSMRPPVEIVHGARDWLLGIDQHAYELARRLPNARVAPAPDAGHMAHHARPDLVEVAIRRIVDESDDIRDAPTL